MPHLLDSAVSLFQRHFGQDPAGAARAPGRVEFIGNHTDYNGGMVIGAAIDRACVAVGRRRNDRRVRLISAGYGERVVETTLDALDPVSGPDRWVNYPIGVLVMLERAGVSIDHGIDVAFESSVPRGAGLSSSAALELATAELVLRLTGAELDPLTLVRACRRAENEFVGVPSGILDQGVSKFARAEHVVTIDCRTEEFSSAPLPPGTRFWIFNSHTKHSLVGSLYEERHRECMEALSILRQRNPALTHLTDASPEEVEDAREALGEVRYRRAFHITSEHRRVKEALRALREHDTQRLGRLLFASHESSRRYFENSTPELDFLVDALREQPHVIGARLTGGGFGGAVLAVTTSAFRDESAAVAESYRQQFSSDLEVIHCRTSDGARPIPVADKVI